MNVSGILRDSLVLSHALACQMIRPTGQDSRRTLSPLARCGNPYRRRHGGTVRQRWYEVARREGVSEADCQRISSAFGYQGF